MKLVTYLIIEKVSTAARMREKITVRMAIIDPNIAAVLSTDVAAVLSTSIAVVYILAVEIVASGIPIYVCVWSGGREGWRENVCVCEYV